MALIRGADEADVAQLAVRFARDGRFVRYLEQQRRGERAVLVADVDGMLEGYVTIAWRSDYGPFRDATIPELVDLNVRESARRRGIGRSLLDAAESLVATRSPVVGLGVGLDADYGPAHRLYARRGYVPDGRGATWRGRHVKWGDVVTIDDDLTLHLTKQVSRI